MKAILVLLSSLVFLVTILLSGAFFTAYVIAEPEPHKFSHIDTPDLWTPKPVAVKTAAQSYERLPAAPAVASLPASDLNGSLPAKGQQALSLQSSDVDHTMTGSVATEASAIEEAALDSAEAPAGEVVDTAQADWCYARYRSYRVEDNSYQPFSGGPRRQCEAPGMRAQEAASVSPSNDPYATDMAELSGPRGSVETFAAGASHTSMNEVRGGSHEDWCLARYRSYRAEDNSYQPFDGGPRRACQSPFG